MKTITTATFAALILAAGLFTSVLPASADPYWIPGRPRVDQVNLRRDNQYSAIRWDAQRGLLTPWQQSQLWSEERSIGNEEQRLRNAHGGGLTYTDQVALDSRLNQVQNQLWRDTHPL